MFVNKQYKSLWLVQHFHPFVFFLLSSFFFIKLDHNKLKVKCSTSYAFAKCTSASTGTWGESNREDEILVISTVVRRLPPQITIRRTLIPSVVWFVPGSVVFDEGKMNPIIVLLELAITINI